MGYGKFSSELVRLTQQAPCAPPNRGMTREFPALDGTSAIDGSATPRFPPSRTSYVALLEKEGEKLRRGRAPRRPRAAIAATA